MTSKVHDAMHGDALEVEEGGVITVKSGGRLNLESGARLELAGSDLAAEFAKIDAMTPVTAELNTLAGIVASATMASTPASGSCAVQLTLKDSAGATMARKTAGLLYVSNAGGTAIAGATSVAVLTNGAIEELVAGKVDLFISSAAGLLGFTLTAAAGSYYASLVLPNGSVITTAAIVVNA